MAKPLYNFDFTLKLTGTGETPEEAYDVALSGLIEQTLGGKAPAFDSFTKYSEPVVDTIHLECAICGQEEEVRIDDMGEWIPEVYLGEYHLGCVCPDCILRYCDQDDDGIPEVVLYKIDFQSGRCRPLIKTIMTIANA